MKHGKCRMEFRLSSMLDSPRAAYSPDTIQSETEFEVWIDPDAGQWVAEAEGRQGRGDCRINAICDWIVLRHGIHPSDDTP